MPAAGVTASGRGGGHLPPPRTGLACVPCRPSEPRPTQGHIGDRALPNGGVGRSCRALRSLRPLAHLLQLLSQSALPKVPGRRGQAMAGRPPGRTLARAPGLRRGRLYFHVVFTLLRPIADIAYQNKALVYDLSLRTAAETLITIAADPKHLGARIGLTAVLHTWGSALTHHPHAHIIVPGGGLSPDGQHWIACRPRFFLSVEVL